MISGGDASASENKILVYKSFSQKYLMPAKKTTYKFIGSTEIYLEDAAKIHLCPGKSQSCNWRSHEKRVFPVTNHWPIGRGGQPSQSSWQNKISFLTTSLGKLFIQKVMNFVKKFHRFHSILSKRCLSYLYLSRICIPTGNFQWLNEFQSKFLVGGHL